MFADMRSPKAQTQPLLNPQTDRFFAARIFSRITLSGRVRFRRRRIAGKPGVGRGTVRRYLEPGQRVRDRDGPGDPALVADATVSNAAILTAESECVLDRCEGASVHASTA